MKFTGVRVFFVCFFVFQTPFTVKFTGVRFFFFFFAFQTPFTSKTGQLQMIMLKFFHVFVRFVTVYSTYAIVNQKVVT